MDKTKFRSLRLALNDDTLSTLVVHGPEDLPEDKRSEFRLTLGLFGIVCEDDSKLCDAARSIANRSVRLR